MKNNLIFTGLAENINKNTEHVLRQCLNQERDIDWDVEFGNVHRLGKEAREGCALLLRAVFTTNSLLWLQKPRANYKISHKVSMNNSRQ